VHVAMFFFCFPFFFSGAGDADTATAEWPDLQTPAQQTYSVFCQQCWAHIGFSAPDFWDHSHRRQCARLALPKAEYLEPIIHPCKVGPSTNQEALVP